MMMTEMISKEAARQFLVNYHNLNTSQAFSGLEGILKLFRKLGSIQYDPLNVVGRNADLVLQSRIRDYKPEMLHQLLYNEHSLIDGFDKEMCIYLSEDFPKFERIRAANGLNTRNTLLRRKQLEALDLLEEICDHISKHGAIASKDISIGESRQSRWGHRKLSSAALDYLYVIGELCVSNKIGTQKIYDFAKNVIPFHANMKEDFQNEDEFLCWYVKRRIGSVGLLWDKSGGAWQGHFLSDKKKREKALKQLLEQGELSCIYVENIKAPFYFLKEDKHYFDLKNNDKQVRFLAPLDNLLWDREMISKLFAFDYRWEVYTPAVKRRYGYYVLPVLYGNQLIARFEPLKAKKNTLFQIKNWWWEPDVRISNDLLASIDIAFRDFCQFLDIEYSKELINTIVSAASRA
jgi:uncharacterized protein YcaQ